MRFSNADVEIVMLQRLAMNCVLLERCRIFGQLVCNCAGPLQPTVKRGGRGVNG